MKLRDYLKTLDKEQIVAIGAKNGSSFMYISKAGNEEFIAQTFDKYLRKIKYSLENYYSDLHFNCFSLPKFDEDDGKDERNEKMKIYVRKLNGILVTIENYEKYIKDFVPVMEREVLETYHKEVDDCEVILVKGNEYGDFWFKSEFDKKYRIK